MTLSPNSYLHSREPLTLETRSDFYERIVKYSYVESPRDKIRVHLVAMRRWDDAQEKASVVVHLKDGNSFLIKEDDNLSYYIPPDTLPESARGTCRNLQGY